MKEQCIRQMLDHVHEYPNPTATAQVVAQRIGIGVESVRHGYVRAQIDSGQRRGATSEELSDMSGLS